MLTLFNDIIGQNKAKHILETAFANGKTSHAYLFKGASGIGKKMTAHGFAALLNCAAPTGTEVCEVCPSCKKFKSANHPDFYVIEPDGVGITIGQIRELQKKLAFPPFEAKTRVILLPDIHDTMRRPEVANGLLKTLEEPPENTMLILTGDEAYAILPTIISRCQVIPFTPLPFADVAALLTCDEINQQQAMTLAATAEGSPGRARQHQKKGFLEFRTTIIETLMDTDKNSSQAVAKVYAMAKQSSDLKDDAGELLDLLTSWLRDLILLGQAGAKQTRVINQDIAQLDQGLQKWSAGSLMRCLDAIEMARQQLKRNCNRALVFEVLFFALLSEKW